MSSDIDVALPVDAEHVMITYLREVVDPLGIDIDVRGGGGRFVRVRRIGGTELSPLHDQPSLDVIVWHDDDKSRMGLALQLWQHTRAACDEVDDAVLLYDSTTLGPRQMPDPADDTKTCCMFSVVMITRPI